MVNIEALARHSKHPLIVAGVAGVAQTVVWQPGDGWRYMALFQKLPDGSAAMFGCEPSATLVTLYEYPTSKTLPLSGLPHEMYVAEKFGLMGSRNRALTAFLNFAIGDAEYGEKMFSSIIFE